MKQHKPTSTLSKSSKPKLLSEQQIQTVVSEAFPERDGVPEEQIRYLQNLVNKALIWRTELVPASHLNDIENLYSSLRKLQTVLAKPHLKEHLFGIGRWVYLKNVLSGRGITHGITIDVGDPVQDVQDSVENLSDEVDRAIGWLANRQVVDGYVRSTQPRFEHSDVVVVFLPLIYEAVFGSKLGISRNGPGIRFLFAVLREAGFYCEKDRNSAIEAIIRNFTRNKRNKAILDSIRERIRSQASKHVPSLKPDGSECETKS